MDEQDTTPDTEAELPEVSADDEEAELLVEAESQAEDDADPDELEEAEIDGKRVRVSKGYKDYLLREDDYRRKTHQTGEKERSLAAKEQEITQRAQVFGQVQGEIADIRALDKQISEYKAVTPEQWRALRDQDRDRYDDARADHSLLLDKRRELSDAINEKVSRIQGEEGKRQTQWVAKQEAEIKTSIPDWSPVKEQTIKSHICEKFGFNPDDVHPIKDAKLIKVMNHIHKQDMAIKAAKDRAAKARGESVTPITPLRKVGGAGKLNSGPTDRLLKADPAAFDKAFLKSLSR